jgi:hypothetical protein
MLAGTGRQTSIEEKQLLERNDEWRRRRKGQHEGEYCAGIRPKALAE